MNFIDILKPALTLLVYALVLTPFIITIGKRLISHWWQIKIGFWETIFKSFAKKEDE